MKTGNFFMETGWLEDSQFLMTVDGMTSVFLIPLESHILWKMNFIQDMDVTENIFM